MSDDKLHELQQERDKFVYYLVLAETREETLEEIIKKLTAQIEESKKVIDDLLDGLDSNGDPERCGLSEEQWDKRIKAAKHFLSTLERKEDKPNE